MTSFLPANKDKIQWILETNFGNATGNWGLSVAYLGFRGLSDT